MSIIRSLDKQRNLFFVVWDGVVVWEDWFKHVRSLMADADWLAAPRFIASLQSVTDTSTIGDREVEQVRAVLDANREKMAGKRGAIVASEEFWKAKRFGEVIAPFGASVVVFNSLDTACAFLGIDWAETQPMIERLRARLRDSG